MKLHEYQAKELLASYGVQVPEGGVASTPAEANRVAQRLGGTCVVKAQVHAGGRGKAGGIRLVSTAQEAEQAAAALLGTRLVTAQTDPDGVPVGRVLVEQTVEVEQELYLGILIDGSAGSPVVIASRAGGMEIEEIATESPELILRVAIDPVVGFQPFQSRYLSRAMGLSADAAKALTPQLTALYRLFMERDCSMVEINPLVVTKEQRIVALDAKVTIDDSALFRQPAMAELRDLSQENRLEATALEKGIAYVKLDGDVGCLVNGAGLAMATMDIVRAAGFDPANFLDVGGGADPERVAETVRLVLEDPSVKRILVNVFGGIARCDDIARGIVLAMPEERREMPIIVRFLGTNNEEGRQVLQDSGLTIHPITDLNEGVEVLRRLATP
ncbi:MAG: ADP-forming succinate--CoA ligase subunit beta [Chloroflexi bacterium]|nr:ADP-forming succinate--CoA ligase subunit beta [Chloroflexota bacterium]